MYAKRLESSAVAGPLARHVWMKLAAYTRAGCNRHAAASFVQFSHIARAFDGPDG
jgi:hypothetical protein